MDQRLPDIFGYVDFRRYLEDYRKTRKAFDEGFTHDYINMRLGQRGSRSYFNNIVKGRKPLTPVFIDRFIDLLALNANEAKYFRAVVTYNQTSSPQEKEFFFDELVRLNRTPRRLLEKKAYAYYKEWYHSAIRALLDVYAFSENYQNLAKKLYPPITPKQARESIALLSELKLIKKDANGIFRPTEKAISAGERIVDHLVQQYQLKCFDLAKAAAIDQACEPKRLMTMTVSASPKGFERLVGKMQQFKSEVRSIIHKDEEPAERIYQINLQAFPISK